MKLKQIHLLYICRKEKEKYMGRAKKGYEGSWDVISVAIYGFHQQKAEIPNSMSRYATPEKSFKVKVHL